MRLLPLIILFFTSFFGFSQVNFPIKVNGKWGLMDSLGNIALQPEYEAIGLFNAGYAQIQKNGKIGLINENGQEIFTPNYNDIRVVSSSFFTLFKDGRRRLVNLTGDTIIDDDFDYVEVWNEHFIGYMQEDKWGAVNHTGQKIVTPQFSSLQVWKEQYLLTGDSTGVGLIDKTGSEILAANYEEIQFHDSNTFLFKEDSLWGIVNGKGIKQTSNRWNEYKAISPQYIQLMQNDLERVSLYSIAKEKIISENEYSGFLQFNDEQVVSREENGLGLINDNGEKILNAKYEEIHAYPGRLFRAMRKGKWGLIDSNEEIIVDFNYDFIGPPSNSVAVIGQKDKYGVVGLNGELTTAIEYDRIELNDNEAKAFHGDALSILVYNEDGTQEDEDHFNNFGTLKISGGGVKQKIQKSLLTNDADDNQYLLKNFEWFFHRLTETWGLRNRHTGKIKIPPTFPNIQVHKEFGFTIVELNTESEYLYDRTRFKHFKVFGIINNEKGMYSTQTNMIDIRMSDLTAKGLPVARVVFVGGKHGLISRKGGLLLENYAYIGEFEEGRARMSIKGMLTTKMPKNEFHLGGLKNYLASLASPYTLNSLTTYDKKILNSGVLLLENETWGYLDTLGKVTIVPAFDFAMDFKQGAAIVQYNGKWGTIDQEGKELLAPSFDRIHFEARAKNQLLRIYDNCSKYGMVDSSGNVNIPILYEEILPLSEGRAAVKRGGKWGFVDQKGKEVSPCIYEKIQSFSEGLAAVRYKRKWGYLDRNGNLAIPHKYRRVGHFSEGMAWAAEGSFIGYINTKGETIVKPAFHQANSFQEGRAIVRISSDYGIIDPQGKFIVKPKFNKILPYSKDGIAIVRYDGSGSYGLIDQEGNKIGNRKYQKIEPFSEELALVKLNNRYGYVDSEGNEIVAPIYTRAEPFVENRARFIQDGRWGFLDKSGQEIIPAQYSRSLDFKEGRAVVYFGYRNAGLIDPNGNYILEPTINRLVDFAEGRGLVRRNEKSYCYITDDRKFYKGLFQKATGFQCGVAAIKLDGRWGLINTNGLELTLPKFHKVGDFNNGHALIHINRMSGIAGLQGEILIPPEYEYIRYAGNDLFRIEQDNKIGYMDMTGKWVWPLQE